MSFFGSNNNNNNNPSGGFGFGSNTNNNNNNNAGGFGTTSSGGSLFGGNTATSGGFGSGGGFGNSQSAFGANKTTGFGAPATTSAGGMFGGNTSTSGGFGSGNTGGFGTNTNTTSAFGGGNTGGKKLSKYPPSGVPEEEEEEVVVGSTSSNTIDKRAGGLFGANKPAATGFGTSNTGNSLFGGNNTGGSFGNTANTGNSLFGSNNNNTNNATGGFGATNTTTNTGFGGFGASTNANATNNNNGTAGTPFQAFTEKDSAAAGSQTSHYQTITFQQPYSNKSFEELRTEDYMQGRKFGNTNGQAGSFGANTGFGSSVFGASNNATNTSNTGGLFGNNAAANNTNNSNSTFGGFGNAANTTASTFGASNTTGGALFGNKPSTSSVFGNNATPGAATTGFGGAANSGGGLFGGGGGGSSGFGTNNTTTPANPGGGLFGNNNNAQPKPAFGGFGAANTTGGFGNTNANPGGGLFGNNANTANPTGGLFGSNNTQQQQTNSQFGASTNNTGGLFGNQNKPAAGGLFGNNATNNTGGSLFGSTTNNNTGGGLFGGANNANPGGGLFGNNQQQNKPATTGLFGNSAASNTTGGGLFGNANTQQPGGSLFGGSAINSTSLFGSTQNKPAATGLFGNNTNAASTGGGLFGNNTQPAQQNTGTSLFGSLNQNTQNQTATGGLPFGSLGQSSSQAIPNQLHASLTNAPYGNEQLFSSLGAGTSPHVGPLATPLSGAKPQPTKTLSLMASTRLNSPVYTPRNGSIGRNGYGLNYSTYGTPGSAYSVSLTPGASSLLKPTGSIGSGLASRLMKSVSMSSLRGDGTPNNGESLLRPTPGSTSSRYVNTGSMRRLNIDRSLRTDLFSPPENKHLDTAKDNDRGLKKQVSFDNTTHVADAEPSASNALVRTEDDSRDEPSPGLIRAGPVSYPDLNRTTEGDRSNGASNLSAVPEDRESSQQATSSANMRLSSSALQDAEPGEYWTKPALKDIKQMSRAQLSKMGGLTVGRDNVGRIEFGPCDLTNVPLDDICGNIVKLVTRTATVYTDDANKPAVGKGLNVPSTIYLERSWPRSNGGKKAVSAKQGKEYDKHIARLKRVHDTHFKSYDPDTGVWCFTVDHYTTYGLDDDDEDMTEDLLQDSNAYEDRPTTPSPQDDDIMQNMDTNGDSAEDDTFQFKLNQRSQYSVQGGVQFPGSIDGVSYDYDDPSADDESVEEDDLRMSGGLGGVELEEEDPFTSSGGAVQPPSPGAIERLQSSMLLGEDADEVENAEQMQARPERELPGSFTVENPKLLRSILKPTRHVQSIMSPEKLAATSWEDHLQQTISPKKRDRQALRDIQQTTYRAPEEDLGESLFKRSILGQSALGQSYLTQKSAKKVGFGNSIMGGQQDDFDKSRAFRTSMDIMNSLWSQDKPSKKSSGISRGFENPYTKKPRLSALSDLDENDAAFHASFKPSFTNNGTIVYAVPGATKQVSGELVSTLRPVIGEHEEVRFAKWAHAADTSANLTKLHQQLTTVEAGRFPRAVTSDDWNFADVAEAITDKSSHEYSIWKLSSILWDHVNVACKPTIGGMTADQVKLYQARLRADTVATFCAQCISSTVDEQVRESRSAERKAFFYLAGNRIQEACDVLMKAKDFRLAIMLSQLPGSEESRRVMTTQIEAWRERNDWSEMSDAVRAIYSILAGEVCVVKGKHGPAENRASEFCIAEKFGLNWMQSFTLRLLFGGHNDLESSVDAYTDDLKSGRETVIPSPRWATTTEEADNREDSLLSLLRLYADPTSVDPADLLDPKTLTGSSSANSRTAWQLSTLFRPKGTILSPSQSDLLTFNYALELETSGKFLLSAWVLLHLSSSVDRANAISTLLERNAHKIPEPISSSDGDGGDGGDGGSDRGGIFEHLTLTLLIPSSLVWQAKSLDARARLSDPSLQTLYLLHAGKVSLAHEILYTTVGPSAVIEEELDDLLLNLISQFPDSPRPEGWDDDDEEEGGKGGVYEAYAKLKGMKGYRARDSEAGRKLMGKLGRGLRGMMVRMRKEDGGGAGAGGGRNGKTGKMMGLEERVAGLEMMRGLGGWIREIGEEDEQDGMLGGVGKKKDGIGSGSGNVNGDGSGGWESYLRGMGMSVVGA